MCTLSMVMDHFQPFEIRPDQVAPFVTLPQVTQAPSVPSLTRPFVVMPTTEASPSTPQATKPVWTPEHIAEFRKAVEAARFLDKLLGAPDCEDPEKAKLIQRVEDLEKIIGKFTGLRLP